MNKEIFCLMKQEGIKLKELVGTHISLSLLYKLKSGKTPFKPKKHIPLLVKSFNIIYEQRNLGKRIQSEDLYITPQQRLDIFVNNSIKDRSVFTKEKQQEIIELGKEKDSHSLVFRYLLGKIYQKENKPKKALDIYLNLLENFDCKDFIYSILIEVMRLEKIENTYDVFLKYKRKIDEAPIRVKSLLYYNTGGDLFRCNKFRLAKKNFEKVIALSEKTIQYYKSWNNLGLCFKEEKKYYEAIDCFKKAVKNPDNYKELERCYINIINCALDMKDEVLLKVMLRKLEIILPSLKNENLCQTYYFMGEAYRYLDNIKKSIDSYEKELEFSDFTHPDFRNEIYMKAITNLMRLYQLNTVKQQELIDIIVKTPIKYISKEFIINLLKYYYTNNMEYEGKLLIEKIKI